MFFILATQHLFTNFTVAVYLEFIFFLLHGMKSSTL